MKFTLRVCIAFLVIFASKSVHSDVEEKTEIDRKIIIVLSSANPSAEKEMKVTIVMLPEKLTIYEHGYGSEGVEISINEDQYIEFEHFLAKKISEDGLRVLDGKSKKELNYTHCWIDIMAQERLFGGFNLFDRDSLEEIIKRLPTPESVDFPSSRVEEILEQVGTGQPM